MVGEKQGPLHNAAREAFKTAARARDFADLLEKYAERLLTPGCEMDAAGLAHAGQGQARRTTRSPL